ncbi:MAG: hypothetical protein PHV17_10360 [Candidatus Omnitrophica bacterium]|nr:hypothetical protein [Candidatus Omnitrophota bacterium]
MVKPSQLLKKNFIFFFSFVIFAQGYGESVNYRENAQVIFEHVAYNICIKAVKRHYFDKLDNKRTIEALVQEEYFNLINLYNGNSAITAQEAKEIVLAEFEDQKDSQILKDYIAESEELSLDLPIYLEYIKYRSMEMSLSGLELKVSVLLFRSFLY